jgi:RimJ/RimL family protein N-acetyltransferase
MIRFNDPQAIHEISRASRVPFIRGHHQCIARFDSNGRVLGGVFFTDYNTVSVQIHVASFRDRWTNKELLYLVFDYPFRRLGVNKLIGTVPENNKKAIAFNLNLGFNVETRVKDVLPEGDMLIMSMYKQDCRFLSMRRPAPTFESNDGKEQSDAG